MAEFAEGRASTVLLYAILAFVSTDISQCNIYTERVKKLAEYNASHFSDLYRTTQGMILLVVLQCILSYPINLTKVQPLGVLRVGNIG